MFWNLRNKLFGFLYGRYLQNDKINITVIVAYLIIASVNCFIGSWILSLICTALFAYWLFRMLSKNTQKRFEENRKFSLKFDKIASFFKFQWKKLKDIKNYRYIKCPNCKITIRVPRKTGRHTLTCPKCNTRFETNIII